MKLRFKIDQGAAMRRGLDAPTSIVTIEVDPKNLSQEYRDLLADRMDGIDVYEMAIESRPGDIIPRKVRSSKLITAEIATYDALLSTVRQNEQSVQIELQECGEQRQTVSQTNETLEASSQAGLNSAELVAQVNRSLQAACADCRLRVDFDPSPAFQAAYAQVETIHQWVNHRHIPPPPDGIRGYVEAFVVFSLMELKRQGDLLLRIVANGERQWNNVKDLPTGSEKRRNRIFNKVLTAIEQFQVRDPLRERARRHLT